MNVHLVLTCISHERGKKTSELSCLTEEMFLISKNPCVDRFII